MIEAKRAAVEAGRGAGVAANPIVATSSGFEGREEMLGQAVAIAIRTLADSVPYQHEINDALVKMHLAHVQFAKNQGLLKELVEDDVQRMMPMLLRMKAAVEKTGNREIALIGIFDRTACHYQLCIDTVVSPGKRVFSPPYALVLRMGTPLGQFDMSEEEIHAAWTKPRLEAYGRVIGVPLRVSNIDSNHKITVDFAA